MDLQGLKTSTLSEIINFARSQIYPPLEQILPYQLESKANIENLGIVPIWAMHLYNCKGIIRKRLAEIDSLPTKQSVSNPQLAMEYDTLSNLYTNLDNYIQSNLKKEFAKRFEENFKVIITAEWQLIGKLSTFA